jgi:hypothetical protein
MTSGVACPSQTLQSPGGAGVVTPLGGDIDGASETGGDDDGPRETDGSLDGVTLPEGAPEGATSCTWRRNDPLAVAVVSCWA